MAQESLAGGKINSTTKQKPPRWFWAIAGLALVWNLMGLAAFVNQTSMDLSVLPSAQAAFYESIPVWATAAFAIAVFGGVVGSLGLLLRKLWATPVLVMSCIGIVVQMSHSFFMGDGLAIFGKSALILPLVTLGIGLALIAFANLSKRRAWI